MAKSNNLRSQYASESAYIRRRLRDIEKVDPDNLIVRKFKNEFPALKDFKLRPSDEAIKLGLEKMKELRKSGALSVKKQKASVGNFIFELNMRGYTFINKSNFSDLIEFLDDARARGLANIYGYEPVLQAIHRARKRGLSDEEIEANIDYWAENKKKGKRLTVRKRTPETDSDNIRRKVRRK